MNLRILKKKSKLAVPLLKHYGAHVGKIFLAERGGNYHSLNIRCSHPREPVFNMCRRGCDAHPLKGTPMVGAMSGYYEPEWYERTCLEELADQVVWGDRPKSMSDVEWQQALRITGCTPADWAALMREL